jgi:hypothetical protein
MRDVRKRRSASGNDAARSKAMLAAATAMQDVRKRRSASGERCSTIESDVSGR